MTEAKAPVRTWAVVFPMVDVYLRGFPAVLTVRARTFERAEVLATRRAERMARAARMGAR